MIGWEVDVLLLYSYVFGGGLSLIDQSKAITPNNLLYYRTTANINVSLDELVLTVREMGHQVGKLSSLCSCILHTSDFDHGCKGAVLPQGSDIPLLAFIALSSCPDLTSGELCIGAVSTSSFGSLLDLASWLSFTIFYRHTRFSDSLSV